MQFPVRPPTPRSLVRCTGSSRERLARAAPFWSSRMGGRGRGRSPARLSSSFVKHRDMCVFPFLRMSGRPVVSAIAVAAQSGNQTALRSAREVHQVGALQRHFLLRKRDRPAHQRFVPHCELLDAHDMQAMRTKALTSPTPLTRRSELPETRETT